MIKNYTVFYFSDYVYIKEINQLFIIQDTGDWRALSEIDRPVTYKKARAYLEEGDE